MLFLGMIIGALLATIVGYYIFKTDNNTRTVKWIFDEKEVDIELKKQTELREEKGTLTKGKVLVGTAYPYDRVCKIWAHKPENVNKDLDEETKDNITKLAIIGHELMHCFVDNLHEE